MNLHVSHIECPSTPDSFGFLEHPLPLLQVGLMLPQFPEALCLLVVAPLDRVNSPLLERGAYSVHGGYKTISKLADLRDVP